MTNLQIVEPSKDKMSNVGQPTLFVAEIREQPLLRRSKIRHQCFKGALATYFPLY